MIEIKSWIGDFAGRLAGEFGARLLFVGYQGSYAWGEATAESDIDVVTVLDELSAGDLERYKRLVGGMPEGGLACGFICGEGELRGWPRFDLLSVALDTKPVLGSLEGLLPEFTEGDRLEALRTGASGLYHAACHTHLYGDRERALPGPGRPRPSRHCCGRRDPGNPAPFFPRHSLLGIPTLLGGTHPT